MPKENKLPTSIGELELDPRNARKRTERSANRIAHSLEQFGAARSIVIDENNRVLCGNGTVEAAAEIGIDRVQVVDVDGDTIVAVRRRGLSEEQKVQLAIADNRTGELSEWDTDVLSELAREVDLTEWFRADELESLLDGLAVDALDAMPELADGDREPIQQMTFTLHDDQAELIKEAIEVAKGMGPFAETGNENSNGNALARVAELFLSWGNEHGIR